MIVIQIPQHCRCLCRYNRGKENISRRPQTLNGRPYLDASFAVASLAHEGRFFFHARSVYWDAAQS